MTETPASRPLILGDHPGLASLLRALPSLQIAVRPEDYIRIEQVFPAGHQRPWSEARDLLADLLAKDPKQHQQVAITFARYIPPPEQKKPHSSHQAGNPAGANHNPSTPTDKPGSNPTPEPAETIDSAEPPPRWPGNLIILLLLLLLLSIIWWFVPPPVEHPPGQPQPETAIQSKQTGLPSDPLANFHSWVPVIKTQRLTSEPLWPPALLLLTGIFGVGWLWLRLRDLQRPNTALPMQRLRYGGQRQPGWHPEQWRLPSTLSPAQRRAITWGVQRFDAEQHRHRLDSNATVNASANAGIPQLRYQRHRRERQVWLWQDTRLRSTRAVALADELATLLRHSGLPLRHASYSSIPDQLWFDGSTPVSVFDLAAPARDALVVIFADIPALRQAAADRSANSRPLQRLLRELSHWPRVCLVDNEPQHGSGDTALGLPLLHPAQLPAWLAEQPLHTALDANTAGSITAAEARQWATACALPGMPITQRQAEELYHQLGLPPAWQLPPPPGARSSAGQWQFSAAERRQLLQPLAARLWQTRSQPGAPKPPSLSGAEHQLSIAISYWQTALRQLDRNDAGARPRNHWHHSRGQHQAHINAQLLTLWNNDAQQRATAIADLYARYRLYSRSDQPQTPELERLKKYLRDRLGELSAQGLGEHSDGRIRLPWRIDPAAERHPDPPGSTRARLLAMGFAGARDSTQLRPSKPALLALGAGVGMALAGALLLTQALLQAPEPTISQFARGTELKPDSPLAQRFSDQARVERHGRQLRASTAKLLLTRQLPPNQQASVHWCWSGIPAPTDPTAACAKLNTPDYQPLRVNQLLTGTDDDTVLLRAGSLAEPIRACAEDWPALSVAAIAAPPWNYPDTDNEPPQAIAARRLAIQLLDSGAVDLAIIGPHWREEARQLATRRAQRDSQWLFFRPIDAEPATAPMLSPEHATHQASISADYEKLARHLRDHVDGALSLQPAEQALPESIARVGQLQGRPRLWGGPQVYTVKLGDGTGMRFVQVCPGTFTIGATGLVRRRLSTIVAEVLEPAAEPITDATRLDIDTLGKERRQQLRSALTARLGVSVSDDDWQSVTNLATARKAWSRSLQWLDEDPAHPLLMDAFAIARSETSVAQLRALGPERLERSSGDDRLPAANIDWTNAAKACDALGGTLPSEAQWEYAARAGSRSAWPWGDDARASDAHAWYAGNSGFRAHPVATKPANPLGLYDMHGNLWEWVQDCWDADSYRQQAAGLTGNPLTDNDQCRQRVLRGGSFDDEPRGLRSAVRGRLGPERRFALIWFRCVRSGARGLDHSIP